MAPLIGDRVRVTAFGKRRLGTIVGVGPVWTRIQYATNHGNVYVTQRKTSCLVEREPKLWVITSFGGYGEQPKQ